MAVQKRKVNVVYRRHKSPLLLSRFVRVCANFKHKRLVGHSLYICSVCCKHKHAAAEIRVG